MVRARICPAGDGARARRAELRDTVDVLGAGASVRDVRCAHRRTARAAALSPRHAALSLRRASSAGSRRSRAQARGLRPGQRVVPRSKVTELAPALGVRAARLGVGLSAEDTAAAGRHGSGQRGGPSRAAHRADLLEARLGLAQVNLGGAGRDGLLELLETAVERAARLALRHARLLLLSCAAALEAHAAQRAPAQIQVFVGGRRALILRRTARGLQEAKPQQHERRHTQPRRNPLHVFSLACATKNGTRFALAPNQGQLMRDI